MTNYHGRHVTVDFNNSEALGICDRTGFPYLRKDLVKQMEWMGDSLQWTGFYVGYDVLDVPNQQNRPPPAIGDPFPVREPRPYQPTDIVFSNIATPWHEITVMSYASWTGVFNGVISPPINQVINELENFNWGAG